MNRDFGSIFSTLLPGTSAKLQPPEGASVTEGLEVKVAFGNVWKETLTELSGGQRSLLALSLILSLLLFKPGEPWPTRPESSRAARPWCPPAALWLMPVFRCVPV